MPVEGCNGIMIINPKTMAGYQISQSTCICINVFYGQNYKILVNKGIQTTK